METHVRNVGNVFFYLGIAMGVIALIALVASGGYSGILLTDDPFYKRKDLASIPLERVLAVIYVTYSMILAIPMAIAGRAILAWKPWGRALGLAVSAFSMLHFPLGSAVGAYAFWVLNDEATEFLFENEPAGRIRR